MLNSIEYILRDMEELDLIEIAEAILEMQDEVGMEAPLSDITQNREWDKDDV